MIKLLGEEGAKRSLKSSKEGVGEWIGVYNMEGVGYNVTVY